MSDKIEQLKGLTLVKIEGLVKGSRRVRFFTDVGIFEMNHDQDCCESVDVEDVVGDVDDLIGNPILLAEEVTYKGTNPPDIKPPEYQDSFTWTFYKLATIKGSVTIRWYGSSNGYYSEEVTFERVQY